MRMVYSCLQPLVFENAIVLPNSLNVILNFFPSFIFFSAYLVIMLNWAEIYHNSIEMSSSQFRLLKPIFFICITFLYTSVIVMFLSDVLFFEMQYSSESQLQNPIEKAIALYDAVLYIPTSIGFMVYCIRIMKKITQVREYSKSKIEVSQRIQKFTILVCIVFCVRSTTCLWVVLTNPRISHEWWFDGAYFFALEILPAGLMMSILRMNTKKSAKHPSMTDPLINP